MNCELDYTLGSSSLTLTVDGVSETVGIAPINSIDSFGGWLSSAGGDVYLDAQYIPEPTTLILLAAGALLGVSRRRTL